MLTKLMNYRLCVNYLSMMNKMNLLQIILSMTKHNLYNIKHEFTNLKRQI